MRYARLHLHYRLLLSWCLRLRARVTTARVLPSTVMEISGKTFDGIRALKILLCRQANACSAMSRQADYLLTTW
jgi:hypothetical protein